MLENISDTPTRQRILTLHPKIRDAAIAAYLQSIEALSGKNSLRVTYGLRSAKEQHSIWLKCHNPDGSRIPDAAWTTNADAWQSYHNYGLALDFCLIDPTTKKPSWNLKADCDEDGLSDWMEVESAFKSNGFELGGEWNHPDNPHVQMIFGHNWRDLLALHNAGKVDAQGYVLI